MSIDKILSPDGIAAEPIEIEIENPDSVSIGMGDLEIVLTPDDIESDFDSNLAEEMDEGDLDSIANELLSDYAD